VVAASGTHDVRFNYALTLGADFGVGQLIRTGPEVMVSPTDGIVAMGGGWAVRMDFIKFSIGYQWIRTTALDGQSLDQMLAPGVELMTRDTYKRVLYVSLSLIGWAPFVPG
jgi:hypothetical protein